MPDVVVIGSGLAGTIAALELSKNGASVALASRSWGVTSMSTGALDLAFSPALSPAHNMPRTIAEHIMDIIAHRRRHPYAQMGLEATIANLMGGWGLLESALGGSGLDVGSLNLENENEFYVSTLGVAYPAAAVFLPHSGGELTRLADKKVGLLSIRGFSGFDAKRVQAGLDTDLRAAGADLPQWSLVEADVGVCGSGVIQAKALETEDVFESLLKAVSKKCSGLDTLVCPPVLGLGEFAKLRGRLEEAAGTKVVEALGCVPSVPGIRFQRALDQAVRNSGVESKGEVVKVHCNQNRIQQVELADGELLGTGNIVLATGRFVTGGVSWSEVCEESLLGLPVITELGPLDVGSPHSVVRGRAEESHPLMTAGVQINESLQPIREGQVAYDNLFAAGMVIGGFASRYALCADGVAISTGCAAARKILERAN